MNLFNKFECCPVVLEQNYKAKHFTFDGCNYYFTINCKKKIIKYSKSCCVEQCYQTSREYDNICYDFKSHCFWTTAKNCYNTIFKLDCCMNEIDSIVICDCEVTGVITGIAYDCCEDKIILSVGCAIVALEKCSGDCTIIYKSHCEFITSVIRLCPVYFITVLKDNKQFVYILNKCGELISSTKVDCKITIQNILFNPCNNKCNIDYIEYLVMKNGCYPYICKQPFCEHEFGFKPCICNYEICQECCCKPDIPCKDPCADILESIALIEASLSHILNAEGEKLQKVLATTDDIEKILCVNKEVNKTIVNVTHLEHVLYGKLQALNENCLCKDFCNENNCDCYSCCDEENICTCDVDGGGL